MPNFPRAPLWAYEHGTLWVREYGGDDAVQIAPRARATFGEARPEASALLAGAMGLTDAFEVTSRFDEGRRCFVAWVEGAIASYGWVSQSAQSIGELERSIRLSADEAYIWDCATLPPYRGQRLYTALLGHIVTTLCHEGIRRLWIGASVKNIYSIRGFASAGFRPVLDLTYLRAPGVRHTWMRSDAAISPELLARAHAALSG